MKKSVFPLLVIIAVNVVWPIQAAAEQVAIVNKASTMNKKMIKRILLAKAGNAHLYLLEDTVKANQFTRSYSGKSVRTVKRKWQRLVFSGRAKAPAKVASSDKMLDLVANDIKAIGHIDSTNLKQIDGIKIIELN